jgi:hypothetical protein
MNLKQQCDPHELKKYEELFSLSKLEFEKAHSRFSSVEEKANRHFSLLIVLLAFVSIGLPEYITIVNSSYSFWRTAFLFLYAVLAMSVLLSIFFYMRAISYTWYKNIVLNQEMFNHFKSNRYVDVIFSLSKRLADDIQTLNKVTDKKLDKANTAFKFTRISLILIVLTVIDYVILKLQ